MDASGENNNETAALGLPGPVSFTDSSENSDEESSNSSERLSEDSLSATDQNEESFDDDYDLPELEDDPRQRIPAGVYARPEAEVLKMVQKGKKVQKVKRYKRKKVPKTVFFSSEVFYNHHRGANAYSQAVNPKKKFFLTVISPSVNLYLLYLFTFLYHFQYLPLI